MTTRPLRVALLAGFVAVPGCGGGPPESLAGFALGHDQAQTMEIARSLGGFQCRLRSSRPKLTVCEGPVDEGIVGVVVRDDTVVSVSLRLEPAPDDRPRRVIRRFARPFGDPVWRDRPYPPLELPPRGYHTLWVDDDTARAIALVCDGEQLTPPCTAELTPISPAGLEARLDTLMGIRR